MFCGCQGKKAINEKQKETVDSPYQIRLIKMFGLHSFIIDKFVFRRKSPSYSIKNIKRVNTFYYDKQQYQPPDLYRIQIQIIQNENNSIPAVRLFPINLKEGEKVPCIVYAHGNSSDLGDSLRFIHNMTNKFKAEYVAFDYTGYGESRKMIVGEDIICRDLQLVLAWLKKPLEEVILWGFSLGTYPVVVNAAKYKVKASILQCPIGSLSCMFYEDYDENIKFNEDHFANIDYISSVSGRVLLMHSTGDEIIPVQQAKLLYRKYIARNGDKLIEFVEVEKIKHNALHKYIINATPNDLQKQVINFLLNIQIEMEKFKYKCQVNSKLKRVFQQINFAILEEYFEEEDFQLEDTEEKTRIEGGSFSQEWSCYRK